MKNLIVTLALLASASAFSATANAQVPFLTHCELDYKLFSLNAVAEIGLGGRGVATCEDTTGNSFQTPVNVQMIGKGLQVGICEAKAKIEGIGVGFTWDEWVSAMVAVDVGPVIFQGAQIGADAKFSPLGFNGEIGISQISMKGACLGLASAQGLLVTKAPQYKLPRYAAEASRL